MAPALTANDLLSLLSIAEEEGLTIAQLKKKLEDDPSYIENSQKTSFTIQIVSGKGFAGTTHSFSLPRSTTVLNVKESVAKMPGIPVHQQRLIFMGKMLEDSQTIEILKNGSTIHLAVNAAAKPSRSSSRSELKRGRTAHEAAPETAAPSQEQADIRKKRKGKQPAKEEEKEDAIMTPAEETPSASGSKSAPPPPAAVSRTASSSDFLPDDLAFPAVDTSDNDESIYGGFFDVQAIKFDSLHHRVPNQELSLKFAQNGQFVRGSFHLTLNSGEDARADAACCGLDLQTNKSERSVTADLYQLHVQRSISVKPYLWRHPGASNLDNTTNVRLFVFLNNKIFSTEEDADDTSDYPLHRSLLRQLNLLSEESSQGVLARTSTLSGVPTTTAVGGMDLAELYNAIKPQWDQEMPQPNGLLPNLRSYQRKALAWMTSRERGTTKTQTAGSSSAGASLNVHPLWTPVKTVNGKTIYYNQFTGRLSLRKYQPEPETRGGILADEMGLGKTIEMIALILSNRRSGKQPKHPEGKLVTKSTLIVSPAAIVSQWENEIQKHAPESLSVLMYNGMKEGGKQLNHDEMASYDVVLTTYETLRTEIHWAKDNSRPLRHQKKYLIQVSPLMKVEWWRICLDEAQMVENSTAQAAQMALQLQTVNRWCVTGTPIGKGLDDLYGLLLFLQQGPYCDSFWWNRALIRPYNLPGAEGERGRKHFYDFMRSVMWRHSKAHVKGQIDLPPQVQDVMYLEFTNVENQRYKELYEEALDYMVRLRRQGQLAEDAPIPGNVSSFVLRLRQNCCHPQVGGHGQEMFGGRLLSMEEVLATMIKDTAADLGSRKRNLCKVLNDYASLMKTQGKKVEASSAIDEALELENVGIVELEAVVAEQEDEHKRKGDKGKEKEAEEEAKKDGGATDASAKKKAENTPANLLRIWKERKLTTLSLRYLTNQDDQAYNEMEDLRRAFLAELRIDVDRALGKFNKELAAASDALLEPLGDTCTEFVESMEKAGFPAKGNAATTRRLKDALGAYSRGEFQNTIDDTSTILESVPDVKANFICRSTARLVRAVASLDLSQTDLTAEDDEADDELTEAQRRRKLSAKYIKQREAEAEIQRQQLLNSVIEDVHVVIKQQASAFYPKFLLAKAHYLLGDVDEASKVAAALQKKDNIAQNNKPNVAFIEILSPTVFMRSMAVHQAIAKLHALRIETKNKILETESAATQNQFNRKHTSAYTSWNTLNETLTVANNAHTALVDSVRAVRRQLKKEIGDLVAQCAVDEAQEKFLKPMQGMIQKVDIVFESFSDDLKGRAAALKQAAKEKDGLWSIWSCGEEYRFRNSELLDLLQPYSVNTAEGATIGQETARLLEERTQARAWVREKASRLQYLKNLETRAEADEDETNGDRNEDGDGDNSCPICFDDITDGLLTPCMHIFCRDCIEDYMRRYGSRCCPVCRSRFQSSDLISTSLRSKKALEDQRKKFTSEKETGRVEISEELARIHREVLSTPLVCADNFGTKINALVKYLLHLKKTDPSAKSLVFSQWQQVLKFACIAMQRNGIKFIQLTGKDKKKAVKDFQTDEETTVFVLNAKSEGAGLTLTRATHVFMLEPIVNTGIELQAINRVHRIGQTKETYVHKLIVQNSIEERAMELASRKLDDTNALNQKQQDDSMKLDELLYLFDMVSE